MAKGGSFEDCCVRARVTVDVFDQSARFTHEMVMMRAISKFVVIVSVTQVMCMHDIFLRKVIDHAVDRRWIAFWNGRLNFCNADRVLLFVQKGKDSNASRCSA